MQSSGLRSKPQAQADWAPILTVAFLFWVFSYALFTSRMQLSGQETSAQLLVMRRLLTTAVGALFYAAVLRFVIFPPGRKPAHPAVLIFSVIPAAAALVAVRMLLDPLVSTEPLPLAEHLRWVLIWAGYFGLWLTGFQMWRTYADRGRPSTKAVAHRSEAPSRRPVASEPAANQAVARLTAALSDELARLPEEDRQALLNGPDAGYAMSDDPLGSEERRRAIIASIADRIAAG